MVDCETLQYQAMTAFPDDLGAGPAEIARFLRLRGSNLREPPNVGLAPTVL